jgi:two-component SAPR family response regulator
MPAAIVLVHDDAEFVEQVVTALRSTGREVAVFSDPMAALDALTEAETVELLITRINFPPGKPHGISLALVARGKRPNIKVLFTARPEFADHVEDIGEFLPVPVKTAKLLAAVERLVQPQDGEIARAG